MEMVGYRANGVGELDPDRYIPTYDIALCDNCREEVPADTIQEIGENDLCESCYEEHEDPYLKRRFVFDDPAIRNDFFAWLEDYAIFEEQEKVIAIINDYIELGDYDYEQFAKRGRIKLKAAKQ